MALADPILTLVVGFQLFLAAFDLLVTVVPLKIALLKPEQECERLTPRRQQFFFKYFLNKWL